MKRSEFLWTVIGAPVAAAFGLQDSEEKPSMGYSAKEMGLEGGKVSADRIVMETSSQKWVLDNKGIRQVS